MAPEFEFVGFQKPKICDSHVSLFQENFSQGGRAYSLLWAIQACVIPEGMVFQSLWSYIGYQF